MNYLKTFLLFSTLILFGCNNNENPNLSSNENRKNNNINAEGPQHNTNNIEDGFYLVINTWEDSTSIIPSTGKIISYSRDFLGDNTSGQPLFIEVNTSEFVPLKLSKKPKGIEQEDKRINLLLSMTDSAGAMLEKFTEKHVTKRICIVIDGEAVTLHKIREKITGGRLQIARCTDNACQHLLVELEDNIEN
jgi:hypothetical protein